MAFQSRKSSNEHSESEDPEFALPDAQVVGDDVPVDAEPEEDEFTKLTRERAEFLDALMRSRADYQNLRRRLQTDIDAAVGRAKESLLLELLMVLDYLDMALASPVESQEAQTLKFGVEMTRNQLMTVLEREGVAIVPTAGNFDPLMHDASELVPGTGLEPGAIVSTLRKGYRIAGRTLRPAQVRVAGEPEPTETTPSNADSEDEQIED